MIIRSANASDIPKILPMIARICALHRSWDAARYGFLPNPEQLYESWLRKVIKNPRNLCLVAEASEDQSESVSDLAAFLIATVEREIPVYTLQEYGLIHDLWVEEAYRHQGIARQLVQQSIRHFTQIGVQQLRLETAAVNEAARSLFSACGFRPSMVEMLIELPS